MHWYEGYMSVEDLADLTSFIGEQHSNSSRGGKSIKTLVPAVQVVGSKTFINSICLISGDEDGNELFFTIGETTTDINLKQWIKHWLDFGTWDCTDIPEVYAESIKQVVTERNFDPFEPFVHGKKIGYGFII